MDNLIGQNPRDSLILIRHENLEIEKERKAREKKAKIRDLIPAAKARYSVTLNLFSRQFLRADVFDALSELQKKELDKFCVSFCRRRASLNSLPFLGSLGGIFYLSFSSPDFLMLLLPWTAVSFLALFWMDTYCKKKQKVFFIDQIAFLLARRKIRSAAALLEIPSLAPDENKFSSVGSLEIIKKADKLKDAA